MSLFRKIGRQVLCIALLSLAAAEAATIILVRHAEKTGDQDDAGLTAAGQARAQALAKALRDSGVQAIYTSQYRRTQDTASPAAKLLAVNPEVIPAQNTDALVSKLKAAPADARILVVTHSDRLPVIVDKLGSKTAPVGHQEYDRMVIVTTGPNGASVLVLRYGD